MIHDSSCLYLRNPRGTSSTLSFDGLKRHNNSKTTVYFELFRGILSSKRTKIKVSLLKHNEDGESFRVGAVKQNLYISTDVIQLNQYYLSASPRTKFSIDVDTTSLLNKFNVNMEGDDRYSIDVQINEIRFSAGDKQKIKHNHQCINYYIYNNSFR